MSESCDNNCSTCQTSCGDQNVTPESLLEKPHEMSNIKKVFAVVSGKGGVGKSSVTSMLAVNLKRAGYNIAILDADITGPSIPKAFGVKEIAQMSEIGLHPVKTKSGIDIMSLNLLMEDETNPVIWRGPIIADTAKQFWTNVVWGDIDYMFVDMPPGTGDIPLTVFQSLPIDGIIIVTSPQELVSMIVEKAVNMAKMMNIPIVGLVENMSYFKCPDCEKVVYPFGESKIEETAQKYNIDTVAKLPIDTTISNYCDRGIIELYNGNWLDDISFMIENIK